MNIVELPISGLQNLPAGLREMADRIEAGYYGKATHIAWVLDSEFAPVSVGLLGTCANPDAVAVLLFESAKINLVHRMGK